MKKKTKRMIKNYLVHLVFAVTTVVSVLLGAYVYSKMDGGMGNVLGASTELESVQLVEQDSVAILSTQVHKGYLGIILIVFSVLALVFVVQGFVAFHKLEREREFGMIDLFKMIGFDVLLVILTTFGLSGINAYVIGRHAPIELNIERVAPDALHITWSSKSPYMTEIVWGYSPMHLDMIELGSRGEAVETEHEILLSVSPTQDVYFKIMADGIKFGEDGVSGFYTSQADEFIYELQDLKLNNVVE